MTNALPSISANTPTMPAPQLSSAEAPAHPTAWHDDFDQRVVVMPPQAADWQASPCDEVSRHRLDLWGAPAERATTIVRYAAGASFRAHRHDRGEEFFVLDGVFEDEHGHYPAGTYVRNPPGTEHAPASSSGCTLWVKLGQYEAGDTTPVVIDTHLADWHPGLVPGLTVLPLHEYQGISTALVRWAPHTVFTPHTHPGGEEIFVLDGVFRDEHGEYPAGTWLRNPRWSRHTPMTGAEGALILVKVGHLGAAFI